eukprot:4894018-Prymnesium_polylepis.1
MLSLSVELGFGESRGDTERAYHMQWCMVSEGLSRIHMQVLSYRKRPGSRHDFPEHNFEHSIMHTSRRPASLTLHGTAHVRIARRPD